MIVSAALLAVAWRPWRDGAPSGHWSAALALGLGYIAGHWFVDRPFANPPVWVEDWMIVLATAAVVVGITESFAGFPGWSRWTVRIVLLVTAIWIALRHYLRDPIELGATTAIISAAVLAGWRVLDVSAKTFRGVTVPLTLFMTATAASVALVLTGNLKVGSLVIALGAALAPWALVTFWRHRISLERGGVVVFSVLLAALVTYGCVSSDMPWYVGVLIGVAPVMPWLVNRDALRRLSSWQIVAARLLAAAIPLLAAVIIAWLESRPDETGEPW